MGRRSTWLVWLVLIATGDVVFTDDEPTRAPNDEIAMKRLKEVQEIVGTWDGSGKRPQSEGWSETIDCHWRFDRKTGPALVLAFTDSGKGGSGRLLEDAIITFDVARGVFQLTARLDKPDSKSPPIVFEGKPKSSTNLVLDRVNKGTAKDELDRLDIKLLNDGDRLVYSFQRRLGTSRQYRQYAQVGLNREGTSLGARQASGPKCIVTGGTAAMTVSYNGQSYYVCCSGCREVFLENPEKFLAKTK